MDIKGLAVVVTGGASGMGAAAAAALANKGAKVSVLARRRETVEAKARCMSIRVVWENQPNLPHWPCISSTMIFSTARSSALMAACICHSYAVSSRERETFRTYKPSVEPDTRANTGRIVNLKGGYAKRYSRSLDGGFSRCIDARMLTCFNKSTTLRCRDVTSEIEGAAGGATARMACRGWLQRPLPSCLHGSDG
jgi:choline dehydrogenase-like flavoprotein